MTARADIDSALPGAPVPAHLRVYVDVLGVDLAVEFLLQFGGGVSYFSEKPQERSPVAALIGADRTREIALKIGSGSIRVPVGKPFLARYFRDKGMAATWIARKLHVTDATVRNMLRAAESRQLSLFETLSAD